MRSTAMILLFSVLLALVSTGDSRAEDTVKRYKIKSGIIEFTLTGTQSGTTTLYFDDWGIKETRDSDLKLTMMGMEQEAKSLSIMDKDWMYNIDMVKKEGTKIANNYYENLLAKSKEEDVTDVEEAMMEGMGGSKTGTEEICGKMCDIWDIPRMKTKTWLWNGISLKTDVQMQGMESVTIATSIKENVDVPAEKFQVPADVTVVERDFGDLLKGLKVRKQSEAGAAEQSETGAPKKPETEPAKQPE